MPAPRSISCPNCGKGFFSASLPIHVKTCADIIARTSYECQFCRNFFPLTLLDAHVPRCGARPLRDDSAFIIPRMPMSHATTTTTREQQRILVSTGAGAGVGAGMGAESAPVGIGIGARCRLCGRSGFAADRLGRHERACSKSSRARPVYNSAARRAVSDDADGGGGGGSGLFGSPKPLPRRPTRGGGAGGGSSLRAAATLLAGGLSGGVAAQEGGGDWRSQSDHFRMLINMRKNTI